MKELQKLRLVDLPLSRIVNYEANPKSRAVKINDLVKEIKLSGIIVPPVITPLSNGTSQIRYVLIDGHRRVMAAAELGYKVI